jgi:hypothetical protein
VRLDTMIAEVRPRNHWEAMDLGWVLARTRYGALLRAWILMVWPVWGLILYGFRHEPMWGVAVIWWLKPMAEKVPLLILSREMFGERMGIGRVLRKWPSVWFGGWFHHLVLTRLSPARHVLLPVRELEEMRGRSFRQRAQRISASCGSHSWLMQVTHLLLLHSLAISIFFFIGAMIPEPYAPDVELFLENGIGEDGLPAWFGWIWLALYLISLTLVSPLCVAAGFGLYLNARTKLEGWDIEIAFRKMAGRMAGTLGVILLLWAGAPGAQAWAAGDPSDLEPGAAIDEILGKPEFKIYTRTDYRPVEPELGEWPEWMGFFGNFSLGFSGLFVAQILIWGLAGLAVSILLVLVVRWLASLRMAGRDPSEKAPVVTTVMGMNVRQDSLPRDLVAAVRRLLADGKFEEAMALLYRGALSWLIHKAHIPIQESDTEWDCLNRVRLGDTASASYFEELTRIWGAAAYGSRRAGREEIEQLLELWPYQGNRREADQ